MTAPPVAQGGQDLDDQNIQAVHQAHAGHSGFAHAGYHKGIRHAHGYRQKLLRQQRQISRTKAWRLKIGSDRVDSALFVLLIRSRYSLFALRKIYMFIIIRREKQKNNICAN